MGRKPKIMKTCTMCGQEKEMVANFYKSYSFMFKGNNERLPLCKECVNKMFQRYLKKTKSSMKALYECCRKLDIYFKESLYISMAEKYDDKVIFGQYISKINSLPQNKGRTFENSDLLDLEKEEKEKQVAYERYKASSEFDLVRKQGKNFTKEELQELEEHYEFYEKKVDLSKIQVERMVVQICIKEIEIEKARMNGENTKDLENLLIKYMNEGSLTPKTMSAMEQSQSQKTFGTWIDDIEQYRPAEYFKDKKIYEDFDSLKEYLERFIFRPLKNLLIGTREFDGEFNVEEDSSGDKNG